MMKLKGLSERKACSLAGLCRSTHRYREKKKDEDVLRGRLRELAAKWSRFGSPRLAVLIRRELGTINHKRVERIYREENLQLPRRRKRKRSGMGIRAPILVPTGPNRRWSMDFMADSFSDGRRFRTLNIIDDFSRECVGIEVDTSLSGRRVVRVLDGISRERPLPEVIVVDNGPEFASKAFLAWCEARSVNVHFIDPGKPVQNAHIESFNARFRDECLNEHWFVGLNHARQAIGAYRRQYNEDRPHSSLGYRTPRDFLAAFEESAQGVVA